MADSISGIATAALASALPVTPASPAATPATGGQPGKASVFGDALGRLIANAEDSANVANSAVDNMLSGQGEVHDAMIALQRAETALELTVQVRNKLVQAYQDIMLMPV